MGLGSTYGDAVPRLHAKEDTAQALMPCAMSSLRGASGVVGCDRVVCPLVLHATTIAHLDVLLCTLLCFLLCAVLLCGAVPLSCGVPCALPALPVVRLRGAVAVVRGCVLPLLSLPSVGVRYGVPCAPCAFLALIPGATPAPHMGCYMWVLYAPYICALFFLGLLFMIRSAHIIKSRPMDSEYGFPKVGLNFRCSVFHFVEFFPGKISGLIFP